MPHFVYPSLIYFPAKSKDTNLQMSVTDTSKSAPHEATSEEIALQQQLARERRKNYALEMVINLVSGCCGGATNVLAGQPLDTVKTKLQLYPNLYKNATDCLKKTWKLDGLLGIYSGLSPNLAVVVVEAAVLFFAYPMAQKSFISPFFNVPTQDFTPFHFACAGSIASIFSATSMTPFEVLKCRMQVMRENILAKGAERAGANVKGQVDFKPPANRVFREIVSHEGRSAMFKGLHAALLRDIIGGFFYIGSYELSLHWLQPDLCLRSEISYPRIFLAGGIGGIMHWASSYPLDVVKSRLQNMTLHRPKARHVAFHIIREEGFLTLYKGIWPLMLRSFPGCGLFFIVYESLRQALSDRFLDTITEEIMCQIKKRD